jgi:transposase InsO family protein
MPWLETDVRDQRIQFVLTVRRGIATVSEACRAFGISRTTGYKWLRREAAAGSVVALTDRSRRPRHSPRQTPTAVVQRLGELRAHFGWGGAKLAPLMAAEGYAVTPRTIDRWIQREGWTRADAAPAPALRRFVHPAPNDLWQMDAKGAYPLADRQRCHTLSVLDDHSRFVVGLTPLLRLQTAAVRAALIRSFEQYGVPTAILMDHGAPWWSTSGPGGLTRLGVFLIQQGIRVVFSAVRHPQTQGKVERFHRTLAERLRWVGVPTTLAGFTRTLAWFRQEYNEVRPHAALGLTPPATHFTASARAYCPTPRPWDYPTGLEIRRVHHTGSICVAGAAYFISEALTGEDVACLPLADRLLVIYRHMYVRELHPRRRASVPLMQPVDEVWPTKPIADVLTMS